MALLIHRNESTYQLGVWKMDETIEQLLEFLPEKTYYEEEIKRFKASHRIHEWLSVRALLYTLLKTHQPVKYLSTGKPYLDNQYISISHTKGYVAVIVSSNAEVGIDIEQYSRRVHKVATKFMRDDEVTVTYKEDSTWSLLLHWSAKETMFKSIDDCEIDFRKHLHILPFNVNDTGSFESIEYKTVNQYKFHINYLLNPEFVLTWQIK